MKPIVLILFQIIGGVALGAFLSIFSIPFASHINGLLNGKKKTSIAEGVLFLLFAATPVATLLVYSNIPVISWIIAISTAVYIYWNMDNN